MVSVWSDQAKRHAIGCPAATGSSGMSRIFSLVRLLARASAVFAVGRYNLCEWLPFQEDPTVPSPFPGMNPFMEHSDFWTTVHFLMIGAMPHRLAAQVRSGFLVHVDSHVWIHELVDDEEGRGSGKRLLGRGDAFISKVGASTEADFVSSEAATAVLTPARRILIPTVDIERQHYLEIRDKRSREIVTILELLSPANKNSGPDRVQYLNKRAEILASPAHLVEIDLLRCGAQCPIVSVLPARTESWSAAMRSGQQPSSGRSGCDSHCPPFPCRCGRAVRTPSSTSKNCCTRFTTVEPTRRKSMNKRLILRSIPRISSGQSESWSKPDAKWPFVNLGDSIPTGWLWR